MSASDVATAMAAAAAALASGDYDTAEDQALAAQAHLAAMPDSTKGSTGLQWSDARINQFIHNVRLRRNRSLAATLGVQRTKITRARVSS